MLPPPKATPKVPAPLPSPEEIPFRVTGLGPCRAGLPLATPAAERLDVYVTADGALRVNGNFTDPDAVDQSMRSADEKLRTSGLLFVIPNVQSAWDTVKEVLNRGAAAGWTRIALAVSFRDNPGQGRVLPMAIPSGDGSDISKGLDPVLVKVDAGSANTFTINGEACKDPATLESKAKALHDEYELMTEGYSKDVEKTPWTVDGTGATAGSVIAAFDALAGAGVKQVRITGVRKPAEGGK